MKDLYAGVTLSQWGRQEGNCVQCPADDLTTRKAPPQDPQLPRNRRETWLSCITKTQSIPMGDDGQGVERLGTKRGSPREPGTFLWSKFVYNRKT